MTLVLQHVASGEGLSQCFQTLWLPRSLLRSTKLCAQRLPGTPEHLARLCQRRNLNGALGFNQDSHPVPKRRAAVLAHTPKHLVSQPKLRCLTTLSQSVYKFTEGMKAPA